MRLRRALAVLLAAFAALCPVSSVSHASAPIAAAIAHGYDVPTVARVGIHVIGTAGASQIQFTDARDGPVSPSVEVRDTPTTPLSRSVATEAGSAVNVSTDGYSAEDPSAMGRLFG